MNNSIDNQKQYLPPVFMATTRQKILFNEQKLPHSFFEIKHPKTMSAIYYLSDITKEIISFAKHR